MVKIVMYFDNVLLLIPNKKLDNVIDLINRCNDSETIVKDSQKNIQKYGKGKADVFAIVIKHVFKSKNLLHNGAI